MNKQLELLRSVRIALQSGDYISAIGHLEKVAEYAQQQGERGAAARHLGNVALTYYRIGNPKQALEAFERALELARADQNRATENGLLGNMGNILREVKRFDDAIEYLNDALLIANEIGDNRGRGIWLTNLGLVYDDLHLPDEAIPLHKEAVNVARQLHDRLSLSSRLANLGNSYIEQGDMLEGAKQFKEALAYSKLLGNKEEQAFRTGIIGNVYAEYARSLLPDDAAYEHFSNALEYYGKAMTLMREIGDGASEAEVIRSIGNVLADAGQYDDAKQYLNAAQQMFEELGLRRQANYNRTTLTRLIEFLEQDGATG